MEHILISPGKLKLMLTRRDLEAYGLDCSTLDSEDVLARRAFRTLLSDVKRTAGFDAADDRVFIQLYPSRDGGAEIYITRLLEKNAPTPPAKPVRSIDVYRFDSLSLLLAACAHAEHAAPQESSAWQDGNTCYLIAEDCGCAHKKGKNDAREHFNRYMCLYGRMLTGRAAVEYVHEHCRPITECDAVKTLARLA